MAVVTMTPRSTMQRGVKPLPAPQKIDQCSQLHINLCKKLNILHYILTTMA